MNRLLLSRPKIQNKKLGDSMSGIMESLVQTSVCHNDQTSHAEKELQAQAFAEISLILLSAGYFRARIATLSEFDKVRIIGVQSSCVSFR